ncbi:MAG: cyanophycin synthetase [Phycisphaerae bacterium]|jgi:dihydrofolate synthase/folylpolyglutamate synthase
MPEPLSKDVIIDQDGAMRYLAARLNVETSSPSSIDAAKVFTLDRMRSLLESMGRPHLAYPVVHVAGSKGKGSVCEMIAAGLSGGGVRAGLYTSPHLQRINERIRVAGVEIDPARFTELVREVAGHAEKVERPGDPCTYFELLTAVAFAHFAAERVDAAVIEVGLGGRDDATNVVEPAVCVIGAIQLEHTQLLGDSLAAIAAIKAGILKKGVPAVTLPQDPAAAGAIAARAVVVGAPLRVVGGAGVEYSHRYGLPDGASSRSMRVTLKADGLHWLHVEVPYAGEHQAWNCGLALAALGLLKGRGVQFELDAVSKGIAAAPGRGRLEWMQVGEGGGARKVAIDIAHTPDSLAALMRALSVVSSHESLVCVVGIAADKDVDGILRAVAGGADKVFFTRAPGHRRGADPEDLLRRYEAVGGGMAQCVLDFEGCLDAALRSAGPRDVVLVAGSHVIAGAARTSVVRRSNRG